MSNKILFFIIAMIVPSVAFAAITPPTGQGGIAWSISTGLGYDSNVYHAPRATYTDYAAVPVGSNPTVVPQKKSGYFIPYEMKAELAKKPERDNRLLGAVTADGSFYLGGFSNANDYNVRLLAGPEFVLGREGKSENTLYVGALIGKHKQVYFDHDSGLDKATTLSGTDISNRYSYMSTGFEAKYKHRTGKVDFGFVGQYINYDYEDPVVVSQQDHAYSRLGADVSLPIATQIKLDLSLDHTVRDYSDRHTHDAMGVYSSTNPLLLYTYNAFGATLRNRISPDWLLYLDYDHTQRADAYVGYNDYKENRYGARLLYEQGRFKSRLALHHWGRDYPNGFAFDVAGQGAKTYSGNDLKFKAELEQTKNSSFWAELVYKSQNSTDLRYDFVGSQIAAGMSWAY
ncbi:MAG TPA: hypothetical protein VLS47_10025 [Gallionella sp.]|nr:hypothetical protein [Gallionella sp.]